MFRQVVAFRWALERLREIPELLAMNMGDDASHFDGNFDFVGERVAVQQDWAADSS